MNRYVEISPTCLLIISKEGILLETNDGIFGVKNKKELPKEEISNILEKLLSHEELKESKEEKDLELLKDIFLIHPESRKVVLSETEVLAKGFWGDMFDILKTGKTKQEKEEQEDLVKYLSKNAGRYKSFEKAAETSKDFKEFIEKNKDKLSPEYINNLNQILKVHPDFVKAIHKALNNKPLLVAVKMLDLPEFESFKGDESEEDLVFYGELALTEKGLKKKEDFTGVQIKRINPEDVRPSKENRVLVYKMTIDGLTKFLTKFPKVKHKINYDV